MPRAYRDKGVPRTDLSSLVPEGMAQDLLELFRLHPMRGGQGGVLYATAENIARLVSAVSRTGVIGLSLDLTGIPRTAWDNWIGFAKEGVEPWVSIVASVQAARAAVVLAYQAKVAESEDWGAQSWLLERLEKDTYHLPKGNFPQNINLTLQPTPAQIADAEARVLEERNGTD